LPDTRLDDPCPELWLRPLPGPEYELDLLELRPSDAPLTGLSEVPDPERPARTLLAAPVAALDAESALDAERDSELAGSELVACLPVPAGSATERTADPLVEPPACFDGVSEPASSEPTEPTVERTASPAASVWLIGPVRLLNADPTGDEPTLDTEPDSAWPDSA